MLTEKGISLQVDSQKRIGVTDVINMLKCLRNETVIKIVKTSEQSDKTFPAESSQGGIPLRDKFDKSSAVKGNTDLPQIRELNEIAAILRSMEVQQNQLGS